MSRSDDVKKAEELFKQYQDSPLSNEGFKALHQFEEMMNNNNTLQKDFLRQVVQKESDPVRQNNLAKAIVSEGRFTKGLSNNPDKATLENVNRLVLSGKSLAEEAMIELQKNPNSPLGLKLALQVQNQVKLASDAIPGFKQVMEKANKILNRGVQANPNNSEQIEQKNLQRIAMNATTNQLGATLLGPTMGLAVCVVRGPQIGGSVLSGGIAHMFKDNSSSAKTAHPITVEEVVKSKTPFDALKAPSPFKDKT